MKPTIIHSNPEISWLIGLIEGEGHCGYHNRAQVVTIKMVDEDVINRAADIMWAIVGGVRPSIDTRDNSWMLNRQDTFAVYVTGERARILMGVILPYMGRKKRADIWKALNRFKATRYKGLDLVSLLGIGKPIV